MQKLMKSKIFITLLCVLILFGIWNLTWLIMTKNRYHAFIEAVPKDESGTYALLKEDGYTYNVKLPDYLSFTGNLGISNIKKGEALIIWPEITGGYKFGIRLQKDGTAYEIYVNENMEPVYKDDMESVQLIQKYKADVDRLLVKANEVWKLNQ